MLRYDLSKLANRRSGTVALLPQMQESPRLEKQLLTIMRAMLRTLAGAIRSEVLPVVAMERQQARAEFQITMDMDGTPFDRVRQLGNALANNAAASVERVLTLENYRHSAHFMQTAKSTLGVDLSAVIQQSDTAPYLETAVARNVGLIKGLSDATVSRVQNTITNHIAQGGTVKDLQKTLKNDLGVSDSRARLIARDQTAKFNSDLNRIRHQQAGITHYVWRTSHDERVRPRHKQLEGKTYEYGKRTGAEDGLPPGQPIQCRCVAQAIVEFGEAPSLPAAVAEASPPSSVSVPVRAVRTPKTKSPVTPPVVTPPPPADNKLVTIPRPKKEDFTKWTAAQHKNFTREQVDGVNTYSGSFYEPINKSLRGVGYGDPRDHGYDDLAQFEQAVDSAVRKLDSAFQSNASKLPEAMTVFRGIKNFGATFKGVENIDDLVQFSDKGFFSTSTDAEISKKFAYFGKTDRPVLMQMNLPKDYKAVLLDEMGESEVLLERGTKFNVIKVVKGHRYEVGTGSFGTTKVEAVVDLLIVEPVP